MSRIIKSVSLDQESSAIADSLPNFSHFVRECLYRHAVQSVTECVEPKPERFQGRCNPLTPKNCFVCWPEGKPSKEAVKQWSADRLSMTWLDMKAKEANAHLISLQGANTRKRITSMPKNRGGKRTLLEKLLPKYLRLRRERKALENPRQPKEQE
jgi:hypothetical protein